MCVCVDLKLSGDALLIGGRCIKRLLVLTDHPLMFPGDMLEHCHLFVLRVEILLQLLQLGGGGLVGGHHLVHGLGQLLQAVHHIGRLLRLSGLLAGISLRWRCTAGIWVGTWNWTCLGIGILRWHLWRRTTSTRRRALHLRRIARRRAGLRWRLSRLTLGRCGLLWSRRLKGGFDAGTGSSDLRNGVVDL